MKPVLTAFLALAALLAGCAGTPGSYGTRYVPVFDLQDKDATRYRNDLAECQALAEQRGNTAQQAAAGALAAALLGAGAGAGSAIDTQQDIVGKCLAGRGYRVLD